MISTQRGPRAPTRSGRQALIALCAVCVLCVEPLVLSLLCARTSSPGLAAAGASTGTAGASTRPAPIRLDNYAGCETIRYPVALLRGTLADASLTAVTAVNASSRRDTRELSGPAHKGRFKVLAELVPGDNRLVIRAGGHELPVMIRYKPQTNPRVVRVFYFTDSSGRTEYQTPLENDPQDYRGKLDTAMKLMQTFTAERLADIGLPRATFNLELDRDGKVAVHLLRGRHDVGHYHRLDDLALYGEAGGEIARQFPRAAAKNVVVVAFTRFDPAARKVYSHTALGGGDLALFGGGDLFAWPSSLADVPRAFSDATPVDPARFFSDSVGRDTFWANASTTIGAVLHELGHTFDLPHSRDAHDIMTRGIDRLNRAFTLVEPPHARRKVPYEFRDDEVAWWAPVSAAALVPNRFFALDDRPYGDEPKTRMRIDAASRSVVIESDYALRYVGISRILPKAGVEALYHVPVGDGASPARQVRLPLAELKALMPGVSPQTRTAASAVAAEGDVGIRAIDDQGLLTSLRLSELLAGPFVQAWRFAAITLPWTDPGSFVDLDAAKLARIEASAAGARLARSRMPFVDFAALSGAEARENVAAYAVRTIRSDRTRRIRLHTGSDDALRIWLNGRLITRVLALRPAKADAETTTAELRKGDNTLTVEVSQRGGGWGLLLRLEDEDGTKLDLTDDGELTPVPRL